MKKIIYIPPAFKIKKKTIVNLIICIFYDFKTLIKNIFKKEFLTNSTSSYLEQSLRMNFKVLEIPYNYSLFFRKYINNNFEGIFINFKFSNQHGPDLNIEKKLLKLSEKFNIKKVAQSYEIIIDGSDNFKTRFLVNEYCIKNKKILISGAISKFDGHVYTFNFSFIFISNYFNNFTFFSFIFST